MRRTSMSLLLLAACVGGRHETESPPVPPIAASRAPVWKEDASLQGFRFEVSEDAPRGSSVDVLPAAPATILSESEARALLARAPALEAEGDERQAFAFRPGSQPPPRAGANVEMPFPPPAAPEPPPEATPGVLEVLRYAPDGAVPMAPHLSVTFDQPMVAVTSHEEASKVRPVRIEPEPPGTWRWIGAKTVLFEASGADRLPMATTYTVTVPKGTVSANGDTLAAAKTWTFTTPPPTVVETWPNWGPQPLDPTMVLVFDQAIDPAAMREHVELRAGSRRFGLRAATEAEVERDATVRGIVERAPKERVLVLHPESPLPAATTFGLVVEVGAPSAEGPNTTTKEQIEEFSTYDRLAIVDQYCWEDDKGRCQPGGPFTLEFNNPLDAQSFDPATVTVSPSPERLKVWASGNVLTISGQTAPHTTYTVTVPASLPDVFGQTLGAAAPRRFETGGRPPSFQGPSQDFLVLDPAAKPVFPVYTTNHRKMRVRVFRASPEKYGIFSKWMREWRYDGSIGGQPPLERISDQVIEVAGYAPDASVETSIDLSPWLADGKGQLVLWVEPQPQPSERWEQVHLIHWVQATNIGLSAWSDAESMTAWVTDLRDGRPVEGVEVSIQGRDVTGDASVSDERGLAEVALLETGDGPHVLVARQGADVAILPEGWGWWNEYGSWAISPRYEEARFFTFDDRHMYRPGETVSVKGWLREITPGPDGDVEMPASMPRSLSWVAYDAYGNEMRKGVADMTATGGFSFTVEIPDTPNLGYARIDLDAGGATGSHGFQIQEFRRPEFEVSASVDPGPYVLGDHATVEVTAAYYAGGALPGADVSWSAHAEQATFQPPNREGWTFGEWVPWWRGWWGPSGATSDWKSLEGRTDATGAHRLGLDFVSVNPPRPWNVLTEATVYDVNRQGWTARAQVLVHPAAWYVGLKTERSFVGQGDKVVVDTILVDLEGEAVVGQTVNVTFARLDWENVQGEWKEVESDPVTCAVTSAAGSTPCEFRPKEGGSYRVRAAIEDAEGRPNQTTLQVWVAGGATPPQRGLQIEELVLVPDAEEYQPGDTARVYVQAPFAPAEGIWMLQRDGVVEEHPFSMPEGSATLEVPLTEAMLPGARLVVEVVGAAPRVDDRGDPLPDKAKRPAQAHGQVDLSIPPRVRELSVVVTPREAALSPGGETTLDLVVTDHAGKPVAAEIAVVAVDEGVLALSGYRVPDPLEVFYTARYGGVSDRHLRSHVELARPEAVALGGLSEGSMGTRGLGGGAGSGYGRGPALRSAAAPPDAAMPMSAPVAESAAMGDAKSIAFEDNGVPGAPIALREDFSATALFAPAVRTDASGKASVALDLPDSLTRYRIMAVAVSGAKHFGSGESTVTARLPVMLRPSPPRFLNFGDRAEMPFVLQNQTDRPQTVKLAVQAVNATFVPDTSTAPSGPPVLVAGREVTVAANDRVEVRVPVAADMAGTAKFQAVIAAGSFSDAARFELPVWTPATSEAFATYGVIDQGLVVQPVAAPTDVWPQFGGLEITTSSTNLQALTDAVLYLVQYPYECNEQLGSRLLAVAALRDVLDAFDAEGLPPPEEIEAAVKRDLERLKIRQLGNGGWGFWGANERDWPYLTVHVAHALVRAKAEGYEVPDTMLSNAMGYLERIESHIPSWYSPESRRAIVAYAVYVRDLGGDRDVAKAKALVREVGVEKTSFEVLGWLLPTLHAGGDTETVAAIVRHMGNNVAETAAGAHFVTSYSDGAHVLLHSDRRVDGVLLESMIRVRPDSDLIPKLVEGLLAHRKRGAWGNTQENSFVLVAMHAYFEAYEKQTPDFVARAWLGDDFVGEHAFRGRSTDRVHAAIPMGMLGDPAGERDLILQKDGTGRLYYRVGMKYAPKDLRYEPADHGFAVEREYAAIDDPADVRRDADGTWHIKAGAQVRVRVTMVAPARRYHVALVDPIPAGLEAQNPALATTATLPEDPQASGGGGYWWWWGPWYEHQNLRDERVEAYASLVWDGVHTYSYVAAATTPGVYVVPPAKAEEMYTPETFGRSASDLVIVE